MSGPEMELSMTRSRRKPNAKENRTKRTRGKKKASVFRLSLPALMQRRTCCACAVFDEYNAYCSHAWRLIPGLYYQIPQAKSRFLMVLGSRQRRGKWALGNT